MFFPLVFLFLLRLIHRQIIAEFLSESFIHGDSEYIFCGYRVPWNEARVICMSYKAELATLNTGRESNFIAEAIADSRWALESFWIGAKTDKQNSWFWISTHDEIDSDKIFSLYSDSNQNRFHCLTIHRKNHDEPIFISVRCDQRRPFICQKDDNKTLGSKIPTIASTRIGTEEFTLFSTKVTWPEAVIQCRKEGLQIAEVLNPNEARALATIMLRVRPAIESAWIGGYFQDDQWKWLPSGIEISKTNNLWKHENQNSNNGCLLLDRHLSQIPYYLDVKCDRKRDVVCQKRYERETNETLIPIFIDDCSYWIGHRAVEWSLAKKLCDQMNATLVTLDSPNKIYHMMNIMANGTKELRHIWTDGRRKLKMTTEGKSSVWEWVWDSTDNRILNSSGKPSPRCLSEECRDHANCLNLNRKNKDTPMIYGVSCDRVQNYVCQPKSGPCSNHRSSIYDDNSLSKRKNIEWDSNTLSISKVNDNFYTSTVGSFSTSPEPTSSMVFTEKRYHQTYLGDNATYEKDVNHDPGTNFTPTTMSISRITHFILSPLYKLTLPSLPGFGIMLVNAESTPPTLEDSFKEPKQLHRDAQPTTELTENLTTLHAADFTTQVPSSSSSMETITTELFNEQVQRPSITKNFEGSNGNIEAKQSNKYREDNVENLSQSKGFVENSTIPTKEAQSNENYKKNITIPIKLPLFESTIGIKTTPTVASTTKQYSSTTINPSTKLRGMILINNSNRNSNDTTISSDIDKPVSNISRNKTRKFLPYNLVRLEPTKESYWNIPKTTPMISTDYYDYENEDVSRKTSIDVGVRRMKVNSPVSKPPKTSKKPRPSTTRKPLDDHKTTTKKSIFQPPNSRYIHHIGSARRSSTSNRNVTSPIAEKLAKALHHVIKSIARNHTRHSKNITKTSEKKQKKLPNQNYRRRLEPAENSKKEHKEETVEEPKEEPKTSILENENLINLIEEKVLSKVTENLKKTLPSKDGELSEKYKKEHKEKTEEEPKKEPKISILENENLINLIEEKVLSKVTENLKTTLPLKDGDTQPKSKGPIFLMPMGPPKFTGPHTSDKWRRVNNIADQFDDTVSRFPIHKIPLHPPGNSYTRIMRLHNSQGLPPLDFNDPKSFHRFGKYLRSRFLPNSGKRETENIRVITKIRENDEEIFDASGSQTVIQSIPEIVMNPRRILSRYKPTNQENNIAFPIYRSKIVSEIGSKTNMKTPTTLPLLDLIKEVKINLHEEPLRRYFGRIFRKRSESKISNKDLNTAWNNFLQQTINTVDGLMIAIDGDKMNLSHPRLGSIKNSQISLRRKCSNFDNFQTLETDCPSRVRQNSITPFQSTAIPLIESSKTMIDNFLSPANWQLDKNDSSKKILTIRNLIEKNFDKQLESSLKERTSWHEIVAPTEFPIYSTVIPHTKNNGSKNYFPDHVLKKIFGSRSTNHEPSSENNQPIIPGKSKNFDRIEISNSRMHIKIPLPLEPSENYSPSKNRQQFLNEINKRVPNDPLNVSRLDFDLELDNSLTDSLNLIRSERSVFENKQKNQDRLGDEENTILLSFLFVIEPKEMGFKDNRRVFRLNLHLPNKHEEGVTDDSLDEDEEWKLDPANEIYNFNKSQRWKKSSTLENMIYLTTESMIVLYPEEEIDLAEYHRNDRKDLLYRALNSFLKIFDDDLTAGGSTSPKNNLWGNP